MTRLAMTRLATVTMLALLLALLLALPAAAQDDIINYSKESAAMNAAMAKGQATLPDFDAALERHIKEAILNVRVPYGSEGANEYLWLNDVHRNADGSYDGTVTDVVAHVPTLHQGSPYHAPRSSVADWVYHDDKGDHGGWTIRLMRESMTPEQRANDHFTFVD